MDKRIENLLNLARRMHRGCRDLRVYESFKRDISRMAADWREYETAVAELAKILKV